MKLRIRTNKNLWKMIGTRMIVAIGLWGAIRDFHPFITLGCISLILVMCHYIGYLDGIQHEREAATVVRVKRYLAKKNA